MTCSLEVIADSYTYYGRIRDEDPVYWNKKYRLWVITRHDDLVRMTRHHELFSSAVFKYDTKAPYPEIYESDLDLYQMVKKYQGDMFIQHDRPEHLDMRRVMHGFFTPKSMEEWRPFVRSAIKDLLGAAEEKGYMVVMRDFALPLPVIVIAEMMGVPKEDRPLNREISTKLLANTRGEPDRMRLMTEGMQQMLDYVSPLVDERMANPGEDFIPVLAQGEKRGVLTRYQVLVNTSLLLLAGHETTINLLCNGALAFIRNPDQWDLLQQDAGETAPPLVSRATEECLRYDPPVRSTTRIALEDVEVRGKLIRKDDRTRWFISPANRDPEKFENPDTFDITRWPNPHVAFGSGIHHCLGVTIARLEGQEAFKAMSSRFPRFHLETDHVEYHASIGFRSVMDLPVKWD